MQRLQCIPAGTARGSCTALPEALTVSEVGLSTPWFLLGTLAQQVNLAPCRYQYRTSSLHAIPVACSGHRVPLPLSSIVMPYYTLSEETLSLRF